MATIIKKIVLGLLIAITSCQLLAHKIYAPNDIPLLDNRFRIDPYTEQITIILNHSAGPQMVVLIRPDGSKMYYQRHPESVGWVSSSERDIITIDKPMAGPWQAVAELDSNNRIRLISDVKLQTNRLPLKLYSQEYITTHATLYLDNELMTNQAYLADAKLSVSLIGGASQKLVLFKDDGKGYDALPFDGQLTSHIYVDLLPGRYLLNIRTKNDVFLRNANKDAVVFLPPITYVANYEEAGSEEVTLVFRVDPQEIDPASVTIDGTIKNGSKRLVDQFIVHSNETISPENIFSIKKTLTYGAFTFSAKAFATTRSGREIELQLPERVVELLPKMVIPESTVSDALSTELALEEEALSSSIWDNLWLIAAIIIAGLLIMAIIVLVIIYRIKNKKVNLADADTSSELVLDELQPTPIDLSKEID